MKNIITILFIASSTLVFGQNVVSDTAYFGSESEGWVKMVIKRNEATSNIPTLSRLIDSLQAVRQMAINALQNKSNINHTHEYNTITGLPVLASVPTLVPLANNFSSTSNSPAAITGWSFAVTTGITYRITVIGAYQTAAPTTGGIIGISLTNATGTVRGWAQGTVVSTAAASNLMIPIVATSGAGSTLTTSGVTAANSPHYIGLDITFTCNGTGTFNIVWGTEVNASAAQINQNSSLIYQALN